MKVKIISDGTSHGTRVVNADTSEAIEGITSLCWAITAGPRTRAVITIEGVAVELEAEDAH